MRRALFLLVGLLSTASASPSLGQSGPEQAGATRAAPELAPNLGWLNTDRPLRLSDELKGHVVVLDFWTYCCINCMHILPDLSYLEEKYKDEPVVVIGVHSAKFENESDRRAIRSAVLRYSIHHPVVVDKDFAIWRRYGAKGWPSFAVIGADGKVVTIKSPFGDAEVVSGEGNRQNLDDAVRTALDAGRKAGTLAKTPFRPKLDANVPAPSGLAFPGKVLAIAPASGDSGLLFIADSTNNRVIEAKLPGAGGKAERIAVFGAREPGLADGDAATARFHDPQGLAYDAAKKTVYVADTKNHAIRAIDLAKNSVSTIAGNGQMGHDRAGGKAGVEQPLNSPWDLALSPDSATLYVAMAGLHQLWTLDLGTGQAQAIAGSGSEGLVDAPAHVAQLAQPSGISLAPDGSALYFADSEDSSARSLDFKSKQVRTIIGGGLFEFGDIDGLYPEARLQHPLGVAVWTRPESEPGGERLLVADTYNHKIKIIDVAGKSAQAWAGVGRGGPGTKPSELVLDEPGGLSVVRVGDHDWVFVADTNNHRIVRIDAASKAWSEVTIIGLGDERTKPATPGSDTTPGVAPAK